MSRCSVEVVLRVDIVLAFGVVGAVHEHVCLFLNEFLDLSLGVGDLPPDLAEQAHVVDVGQLDLLAVAFRIAYKLILVATLKGFLGLGPAVAQLIANSVELANPLVRDSLLGIGKDAVSALLARLTHHGQILFLLKPGIVVALHQLCGKLCLTITQADLLPELCPSELTENIIIVWYLVVGNDRVHEVLSRNHLVVTAVGIVSSQPKARATAPVEVLNFDSVPACLKVPSTVSALHSVETVVVDNLEAIDGKQRTVIAVDVDEPDTSVRHTHVTRDHGTGVFA